MRLLVVGFVLLLAGPAHANMGRHHYPGSRNAEPNGLRAIAIEHEDLAFDLRPLATGDLARVAARYHLVNRGETVTAPLVFVTGIAELTAFRVALDGRELAHDSANVLSAEDIAALPTAWKGPESTPALDGSEPLYYDTEHATSIAFTLAIGPGPHTLEVTYRAVAKQRRSQDGGTIVWQLGYVLAPARDWGGFGGIDIVVDVPAGWRAKISPALARAGDQLTAKLPALPADTIGITVQAPTGVLHDILQIAAPLLALVVVFGGIVVLRAIGRSRSQKLTVWPVAFPVSLAWAVAIVVTGVVTALRSELLLPEGQSAYYGFGHGLGAFAVVILAVIAIPAGVLIARSGSRSG